MKIHPLDLSYQKILEERLHLLNLQISEYSFANLYLFRSMHNPEVVLLGDRIFIRGLTRDGERFIMLTSHPEDLPVSSLLQVLSMGRILYPLPENWLVAIEKKTPNMQWIKRFNEADSDYLFERSKIAAYSGRHFDGKRNLIKQLLDHTQVRVEPLVQQLDDAREVLESWEKERDESSSGTDSLSCSEALLNFHRLHLSGQIAYINGKPGGFVIGEQISKETYAVHFSKALFSPHGIYQLLIRDLARSLEEACIWINLEQDLGIPGLRNSKLSYHPIQLIKKWRIRPL